MTESGGSTDHRDLLDESFRSWDEDRVLQSTCAKNKPYGPQEGESWDLSNPSDVKELFEMIACEQPVVVTGSPPCTAFSQFQNWSLVPKKALFTQTFLFFQGQQSNCDHESHLFTCLSIKAGEGRGTPPLRPATPAGLSARRT